MGGAASHRGLPPSTGAPDQICMATHLLSASTQPLAQQAMELNAAKTQYRSFGVGVHHFPKLS